MNQIQQDQAERERLQAELKERLLAYSKLTLTPEAHASYDEGSKLAQATASAFAAIVKWEPGYCFDLAANVVEDVNYHKEAEIIRNM